MFRTALFACLVALLPAAALADFLEPAGPLVPGEYIVWAGKGGGDEKLRSIAAYAVLGLEVRESLRFVESGLPPAVVVRMPDDLARFLARTGYDVMPQFEVELISEVQEAAPRHLDRIDQRRLPLDQTYRYSFTGKNTGIIVIDSSVLKNPDFADRIIDGVDLVGDNRGPYTDCDQAGTHGTAVTSVAAGDRHGVAKDAGIVVVRVFGCDSRAKGSTILAALNWALGYAKRNPQYQWIVNMSFGSKGSPTVYDSFFKKLDEAGVLLVAGAGNSNIDVAGYTPANSKYVVAVGGTTDRDRRYTNSNFGSRVALYAMAEGVTNYGGSNDQEWSGTGTSLAAPQVAGTLALLGEQFPEVTHKVLKALLLANATPGIVRGTGPKVGLGKLLFNGKFEEAFSTLAARFSPGERRLTIELKVVVPGGGVSPVKQVSLYRGPAKSGACQGRSFATVALQEGAGTVTLRGWAKAPALICARTSFGTVGQVAVETRP